MHSDEIRQVRGARLDVGIVEGLVAVGNHGVSQYAVVHALSQCHNSARMSTDFPLTVTFFLLRSAYNLLIYGGLARNRTGIEGFAVLCVTIPPRGLCRAARAPAYTKDRVLSQGVMPTGGKRGISHGGRGISTLQRRRGLVICASRKHAIP